MVQIDTNLSDESAASLFRFYMHVIQSKWQWSEKHFPIKCLTRRHKLDELTLNMWIM
jgi:hypothetical protein